MVFVRSGLVQNAEQFLSCFRVQEDVLQDMQMRTGIIAV